MIVKNEFESFDQKKFEKDKKEEIERTVKINGDGKEIKIRI